MYTMENKWVCKKYKEIMLVISQGDKQTIGG